MTLTIDLPETIPTSGNFQPLYLKNALIATLYNAGNITEREACTILGTTRREFEDMLPQFGLSVLGDTQEEIGQELHA
ncbi:MAG: UPF0175 family protein [Ignavibacteriales bacterium]|nr:UPF0175 family protein [Ignavibacteriales bacterium]